jgi:cytochrome c peroxidase
MCSHVDSHLGDHPGNARNIAASALLAAFCLITLAPAGPAGAQAPSRDLTALKRDFRRPAPAAIENPALADLGRALFFDPRISGSGNDCGSHEDESGCASRAS